MLSVDHEEGQDADAPQIAAVIISNHLSLRGKPSNRPASMARFAAVDSAGGEHRVRLIHIQKYDLNSICMRIQDANVLRLDIAVKPAV